MTWIDDHLTQIKSILAGKIHDAQIIADSRLEIRTSPENLLEIMTFIAQDLEFPSLEAISGVDWDTYFDVVYHIDRWDGDSTVIQVRVKLDDRDNPEIPSVTSIWASANWHERELFDMFGIVVSGHPNLKRLLLPDDWDEFEHKHISELYPMRRAYKLPEKPFSYKPQPKEDV
ncbi:MAG: NADH-quinone oxidoreductase subunit C [Candidatus Hodarchaeales archaeon]|jgi:NADH:ubiquinone oxidoreductase subunit C